MNISSVSRSNRIGQSNSHGLYNGFRVDWTKTPTKQENLPSMNELREKVKENAKAFANATTDKERDRLTAESKILFTQYVSHVSPDRKELLNKALKTIEKESGKGTGNTKSETIEPKTIFDFLIEADKKEKGMEYDKPYNFDGGTVTAAQTTYGSPRYTVKVGGHNAITIDPRSGIGFFKTPAERTARQDIVDLWFNACDNELVDNRKQNYNPGGGIDVTV
jgi:hypothetical protein